MDKIVKGTVTVVACLVMILAVSSVGIYVLSGKSIFEVFFKERNVGYAIELLDYNGQSYTIDDYTITLEQTLYDSKIHVGYCVFAIIKEAGKPEAKLNPWNQAEGNVYGEDGRFAIQQFATWTVNYEYIGDTLYQYISFKADETFEQTIELLDLKSSNEDGEFERYKFSIKDTSKVREYELNETTNLVLSPLGVSLECSQNIGEMKVTLHYKNGDTEVVVDTNDDIGTAYYRNSEEGEYVTYQCVFENIKDILDIECVEFNGRKIN